MYFLPVLLIVQGPGIKLFCDTLLHLQGIEIFPAP